MLNFAVKNTFTFIILDEILTQADHKDLYKRCDTEMLNKCRENPGRNLWVTLAHNAAQNNMLFVVELESITNQGKDH